MSTRTRRTRTPRQADPSWKVVAVSGSVGKAPVPSAFELRLPAGVRVTVHRWHSLDGWFVTCREINVDRERLDAADLVDAQREAISAMTRRAREIAAACESYAKGER